MGIIIKEVVDNKDLRKFVLFPHVLYAQSCYWVPMLITDEMSTFSHDRNPAFANCEAKYWLAYKDNVVVGRIAGIINHAFVSKWRRKYVRFGWIDFIDDMDVSKALIEAVESWALAKNMDAVHGPLGFTDFDPEGMLVDGFDSPATMTTIYNYPYYPSHLEQLNYKKDVDWVEYEVVVPRQISEHINITARTVAAEYNLHVLQVSKSKELLRFAPQVFELINRSYAYLYGVVPLSTDLIKLYTKQYFPFIDPRYISIVLQHDEVVAFAITIPSLSTALQKSKGKLWPLGAFYLYKALHNNDKADLYLIAVRPDLQSKGVTAMLIKDLQEKFSRNGISKAITHPILEQNGKMLSFWKDFEKTLTKRRRCYIKFLHG